MLDLEIADGGCPDETANRETGWQLDSRTENVSYDRIDLIVHTVKASVQTREAEQASRCYQRSERENV